MPILNVTNAVGEYLYTDPANAGMRSKFDLPLDAR
jgi:hypothetical protein